MPCDEAIRRGEAVRDQAVAKYRLSLLRRTPALLLYDLAGRETVGSRGGGSDEGDTTWSSTSSGA
jgi:hypothetical protein